MFRDNCYISPIQLEVIEANKEYWEKRNEVIDADEYIYVFHGLTSEFEFSIREDIVAKGLQQQYKLPIASVIYGSEQLLCKRLDDSFGIQDSFCFYSKETSYGQKMLAQRYAKKTWNNIDKLLSFRYKGILCGEAIYDNIQRQKYCKEFDCFGLPFSKYCDYFEEAIAIVDESFTLFKKKKPKYIISSEPVYIKGLIASVANALGSSVIVLSPGEIEYMVEVPPKKRYLEDVKQGDLIKGRMLFANSLEKEEKKEEPKENVFVFEVANREGANLKETLGIDNDKKVAFVMAHGIGDAAREVFPQRVFYDYNDWFLQTLKIAKEIKDVNWVFKDHPLANFYGQASYVQKNIEKYLGDNIFLCPKEVSGMDIKEVADCVVTCAGDVGIEYWAYGIPTISAAVSHYSELGISYNAKTMEEYVELLSSVQTLAKPEETQQKYAKGLLADFKKLAVATDELSQIFKECRGKQIGSFKEGDLNASKAHYNFGKNYIDFLHKDCIEKSVIYCADNRIVI